MQVAEGRPLHLLLGQGWYSSLSCFLSLLLGEKRIWLLPNKCVVQCRACCSGAFHLQRIVFLMSCSFHSTFGNDSFSVFDLHMDNLCLSSLLIHVVSLVYMIIPHHHCCFWTLWNLPNCRIVVQVISSFTGFSSSVLASNKWPFYSFR